MTKSPLHIAIMRCMGAFARSIPRASLFVREHAVALLEILEGVRLPPTLSIIAEANASSPLVVRINGEDILLVAEPRPSSKSDATPPMPPLHIPATGSLSALYGCAPASDVVTLFTALLSEMQVVSSRRMPRFSSKP